jgi:hypothetical protein
MAGWMVVIGSLFSIFTAFEVVGRVRSIGTREAIERFLSEPPGSGMGLEVESVIQVLQGTATAAAVIAAMTAVLGFFAVRGDRRARTGLAVLAIPLFVTGLAIGGFLTSLVAAACGLLFVSPSREWYDGKPIPASTFGGSGSAGSGSTPDGLHDAPPEQQAGSQTGPTQPGAGQPGEQPGAAPHPYGVPHSSPYGTATQQPWAAPAERRPARPPSVSIAVALTLVASSIVLLLSLVGLVAVAAAPDLMIDEMQRTRPDLLEQGLTREAIVVTALATAGVLVVASLLAIGFAIALVTRKRWGATGLLVMCVLTAVFSMLAAISSLVALLPGVAAMLVLVNVRHRETQAWLRR